ncbi:MAG: DUF4168 domain-containing protein [Cyanobacteria bacterium P01_A01_bin.135]
MPKQPTVRWLSGVGLGMAIAIAAAGLPVPVASQSASPEAAVSAAEVRQYANSVLRIESLRTVALRDIQPLIGTEALQSLACHQPETVRRLPDTAKDIFVTYCTQSVDVVEQSGLSVSRFNEITTTSRSDAAIATQIQQALQELQAEAVRPNRPSSPAPQSTPETAPNTPADAANPN